jgi:hypothetical protein
MRKDDHSPNASLLVATVSTVGQFSLASVREARGLVLRASGLVLGHGAEEAVWTSHLGHDSGDRQARVRVRILPNLE